MGGRISWVRPHSNHLSLLCRFCVGVVGLVEPFRSYWWVRSRESVSALRLSGKPKRDCELGMSF